MICDVGVVRVKKGVMSASSTVNRPIKVKILRTLRLRKKILMHRITNPCFKELYKLDEGITNTWS